MSEDGSVGDESPIGRDFGLELGADLPVAGSQRRGRKSRSIGALRSLKSTRSDRTSKGDGAPISPAEPTDDEETDDLGEVLPGLDLLPQELSPEAARSAKEVDPDRDDLPGVLQGLNQALHDLSHEAKDPHTCSGQADLRSENADEQADATLQEADPANGPDAGTGQESGPADADADDLSTVLDEINKVLNDINNESDDATDGETKQIHDTAILRRVHPDTALVPVVLAPPPPQSRPSRSLVAPLEVGDRIFHAGARAGGFSVLVIMVVVGLFLTIQATPALRSSGFRFLTTEEWQPDIHNFGIAAVLFYTIAIAAVALAVAIPLATGTALFITEVAPRRLRSWFVAMVDLMAAVPSIVYGLWGLFFLQGQVIGISKWLSVWLGWIPFFTVDGADPSDPASSQSVFTASTFIAGLVVALMVIPISCSIMREVFSQAPPGEREGAFALGATRWGMVRTVVLPFGRGGMIGAIMLGLGRALGETIAVYLLISPVFDIKWHLLQSGSNSVAALIVLRQGDASGFGLSALMAAGLALFVMTLIVNFGASTIVARSRSGAQSEA